MQLARSVSVCVVTHESAGDLPDCLQAIAGLDYRPLNLIVVDCASQDGSAALARRLAPPGIPTHVLQLDTNLGFAGGMNQAIALSSDPFVLAINPDAQPRSDFLTRLLGRASAESASKVGAVSGRLLRPSLDGGPQRLDACGMRLIPTWRHVDRGSGKVDRGQWSEPQRVFGASAAAALYRREALDDVAVSGETFTNVFHSYREDAELCFRLQGRGWQVLYEPAAICVHRRHNVPQRRRSMSAEINFHSLKNRYLLRAYHQDLPNLILTALPTLWRDLLALGWVLLAERSSLAAYRWLWRNRRDIFERRRLIQRRRTAPWHHINRWFLIGGLPL